MRALYDIQPLFPQGVAGNSSFRPEAAISRHPEEAISYQLSARGNSSNRRRRSNSGSRSLIGNCHRAVSSSS
jgi:hypothetical protein